jgi:hypothetical protein
MSLRTDLIKLANEKPEFRPHIIPLLRKFAELSLAGKGGENDSLRFHVYRGSVHVTELKYAGKRGKKVETFVLYDTDMITDPEVEQAIDKWTWRLKGLKYDQAKKEGEKIAEIAKKRNLPSPKVNIRFEKGVRVAPGGVKPIRVKGKHVFLEAEYGSFRIRDLDDNYNDPTCIPAMKGGKKSIKQFYRWVQDNEKKIPSMTFRDVLKAIDKEGIRYHYYCAMD